jgi:hypothetical protein
VGRRLGTWLDEAENRSVGELTGWTAPGEVRHFTADDVRARPLTERGRTVGLAFEAEHTQRWAAARADQAVGDDASVSTADIDDRDAGTSFHSEDAPVVDDGLPVLSSTSTLLRALVLQAIQLEVASTFGADGYVVASALTGQPGQGDAAEELERALAEWLGQHTRELGWRHVPTPSGVPDEPVVLVVPGVIRHDSVNDSPQADDTPPPARARSLREFLNGG